MIKLTDTQKEKLSKIHDYLDTEIGKAGAFIDDCEYTSMYIMFQIYVDVTGIVLKGKNIHLEQMTDRINGKELNNLFTSIKRGDEDFKIFLQNKETVNE